jgi:hypothetical protein
MNQREDERRHAQQHRKSKKEATDEKPEHALNYPTNEPGAVLCSRFRVPGSCSGFELV